MAFAAVAAPLAAQDCPEGVAVDGGAIALANGATEVNIVVDGVADPLEVELAGVVGANTQWVITDADLTILGLPDGPPFDLDGAGAGTCLIWHLAFEGDLTGAMMNANAGELGGCFDLSNAITVERSLPTDVNGGDIALRGGGVDTLTCVDGVAEAIDVDLDGTAVGEAFAWVITDADLNILGLPAAPPFDLDPAGPGTCLIWYLAYNGEVSGAVVGANAADLGGEFDLSNPVTVVRSRPEAGRISFPDGALETSILLDGVADSLTVAFADTSALAGSNTAWVVTDADSTILALPAGPPFDLDEAGDGTCLLWYLRYEDGLRGAETGANAADLAGCFDLSNPVAVQRLEAADVNGGNLRLAGGSVDTATCVDGVAEAIDVDLAIATGETLAWVITDADGEILGLPDAPPFDLDGAGVGTCLIWSLAYDGEVAGAAVGENAADLVGDFDLSNPITVVRQAPDGGTVTIAGGSTDTTAVVGDIRIPVMSSTTADALDYGYVITDDGGVVLGTAIGSADTLDLSGAAAGTCRIYGYSFGAGEVMPAMGDSIGTFTGGCRAVSAEFVTVVREVETSARDLGDVADVRVFPNPATDRLTVAVDAGARADRLEIRLLGASGQELIRRVASGERVTESLDVADLPTGVYTVHLVSGDAAAVRRVVIR